MRCMQQRCSPPKMRLNRHKGHARESSQHHKLKKEHKHNAEEKMEMDTTSQYVKAKLNTCHMGDKIKVQRIHGHGAAGNGTNSKNMSKPSRPALAPFSIKAKSKLLMMIQKGKVKYLMRLLSTTGAKSSTQWAPGKSQSI